MQAYRDPTIRRSEESNEFRGNTEATQEDFGPCGAEKLEE